MTLLHVVGLVFNGHAEMAKKRLQKLKVAGLVKARSAGPFQPSCLFLAQPGVAALISAGALREFPTLSSVSVSKRMQVSDLTLRHELAVMDVKTAFQHEAPKYAVHIRQFLTWPALIQFRTPRGLLKPDGLIRVRDGRGEHTFYLELDRSTEGMRILLNQANAYRACRKSRCCVAPHSWDANLGEHRFIVLYVLQSEARLENLARRLLASLPPIRSLVWLTTKKALENDPFGPIWLRPRDLEEGSGRRVRLLGDA